MTAAACGWITMSMRELDRIKVIEAIIEGRLKPAAAALRLRLTTRQVHRLVQRYREHGAAGLTSRHRGKASNRQFGRAMYELNIESICANSSQAKGRVERANLTLQDRLVKELRLRGISNMADANAFAAHFMASYNARFAKPPRSEHDCHRPLRSDEDPELIFAWREARRVSQRLTVQYDKVLYLLADTAQARRLAGDYVEIYHYPDGRIEPRVNSTALPFTTYDKLCEIDQGAVVENKRLGHVLQVAQVVQAQRDSRRSQSVPGTPRLSKAQKAMPPKKASRDLMPEDIAAALDSTPPQRRSRHA
ncbi:TPA: helix-turn-helix domain-containing protein [Pseudomonas aeruginosa]